MVQLFAQVLAMNAPVDAADALLTAVRDHRDRQAFLDLFRRFAPPVKGWLIRGGLGPRRAEEVTQEVLLKVWSNAHRWRPERGSASTWIFAIARNARVDVLRKRRVPRWEEDDPSFVPDPEPTPAALVEAGQRAAHLHSALSELPTEQAQVLREAYFEHRTLREIAEAGDLSPGTVKSRVRLAMTRLRLALETDE